MSVLSLELGLRDHYFPTPASAVRFTVRLRRASCAKLASRPLYPQPDRFPRNDHPPQTSGRSSVAISPGALIADRTAIENRAGR